jgi:hypothetical protein
MQKTFNLVLKNLAAAVALFLACFSLNGQIDWNYYTPLLASGPIPEDFTLAYADKFEKEAAQIGDDDSYRDKKRKEDFYKRSEYFLNNLLISGDVVFGDTISNYCSLILDKLLKDDPELRAKLRVYVVKTPVVNAFATNSGLILINLGLISQVENEAQLAAVLAHEVVHYKNEHVINEFLEQERVNKGNDLFSSSSTRDDQIKQLSKYSKLLELEADEQGLIDFYINAGYSPLEALYVMDVLQYSYLPFNEVEFEREFLELSSYTLPNGLFLKKVADITAVDDYEDIRSTHPNIKTRKEAITEILDLEESGAKYQIGEEAFTYCQRLARYENTRVFLERRQYGKALYNAFLLKKSYGEDRFQQLCTAKALHAFSVYKSSNKEHRVLEDYEDIEGESQQVYHFLYSIDDDALASLAVAFSYEFYKNYPSELIAEKLFNGSLNNLVFMNELKRSDFKKKIKKKENLSLDSLIAQNKERSSKIAKIKAGKAVEEDLENNNFYHYAFVPYWLDSAFSNAFERLELIFEEQQEEEDYQWVNTYEETAQKYDENKALGIDKLLCVSPQYLKVNNNKDGIEYFNSKERQEDYRNELQNLAKYVNLDMELIEYKDLTPEQTDRFNELLLLKAWLFERFAHKELDVVVSSFDDVQYLKKKYNTNYISTTGNLTIRQKEDYASMIVSSCLIFPIPFIIGDLLIPDYESFNYFFVFDITSGEALLKIYNEFGTNDANDYMRSIIYNNLIQIKSKPKFKD